MLGVQHRQALFEAAVAEATVGEQRLLWYPHAWLFGYLKSKAELLSAAAASLDDEQLMLKSGHLYLKAFSVAHSGCTAVLRNYRQAACATLPQCSLSRWSARLT
jgi:hypothetical protein